VCFRLRRKYDIGAASTLVQDMVCYADDPRIDFETKVDWHEKWRLLKAAFDTGIDATQVRCEVQYGHLFRNTHKNLPQDRAKCEICAHKWISLEETGAGIALLNDCKYGHDAEGGRMRLTLLRAPIAPDGEADQGEHAFTYSLLPFTGAFADSRVVRTGYELNAHVPAHVGGGNYSLFTIDGGSVIAESVKLPENGDTDSLVIRLYESLGGQARTTLHFAQKLSAAHETDMLEGNAKVIPFAGNDLTLEFKPFEIKTLVVRV
jgi:alpha-mannosidase